MAPKGTSLDEKKERLLEEMLKRGEIYSNKTIETLSKPTGISSMVIKNVLQALVNEDLVDTDKIGASTYYWCFASKRSQAARTELARLQKALEEQINFIDKATARIEELKTGREETEERSSLLKEKLALQVRLEEQRSTFRDLLKNDPDVAQKLREYTDIAKQEANLWTDNIFCLQKYMLTKLQLDKKTVSAALGITGEFDYLE
ncbi:Mnd1 [Giardia lamblia P15]|uniref:Mnd1 n=1 Tax=Giardia intestinalis (strain P15) TaxID=658858 RepID=E1EXE7_GIAIA|nr:Mnd1 [Giardia lamblia P15]